MDTTQTYQTQEAESPTIVVDFQTHQFPIYVDTRKGQLVDLNPFFRDLIGRNSPFDNMKEMLDTFEDCFDFILQRLDYTHLDNGNLREMINYMIYFKHTFAKIGKLRNYYLD